MGNQRKWNSHIGLIIDSKDEYDVIFCKKCGFNHIIPIPTKKELNQFYSRKFYEQDRKKNYFELQESQKKWWEKFFKKRCKEFEMEIGKKGKVLDVGCGHGFFLNYARNLGWETVGIEPSSKASQYAKEKFNLNIINGDLESVSEENIEKIDVIYSHGVLEHMRDPKLFFDFSKKALSDNGIVFFSVANDYSPLQIIYKNEKKVESWWLIPPEHINYFNIESTKYIINDYGFELVSLVTSFPIDLFLFFGDDYISKPELGPICHQKRVSFENLLERSGNDKLLKDIYNSFAKAGIGRQIDVICKIKEL